MTSGEFTNFCKSFNGVSLDFSKKIHWVPNNWESAVK